MGGFFYRYRALFKFLGVLALVALGLGFFYGLSLLQPAPVNRENERRMEQLSDYEVAELRDRSQALAEKFEEAYDLGMVGEEQLAQIDEAIDLYYQYASARTGIDRSASQRLNELRRLKQNSLAQPLHEDSQALENEASLAHTRGEHAKSLDLYNRALAMQRTINDDYPLSRFSSAARFAKLRRQVKNIEGQPLYERSLALEKSAQEAVQNGDWEEARGALGEAIELQKELNATYRTTSYSSPKRLDELETEYASLGSSDLMVAIEEAMEQARRLEEAGDYRAAASQLQQALRAQRELNRDYPKSRFASAKRREELEARRQRALSQELGSDILRQVEELDELLRERRTWHAGEAVSELYQKAERFKANFPRSDLLTDEVLLKLQFLNFVQSDIDLIQQRSYGLLGSVPGSEDTYLFRQEISQALYTSLMVSNPSRQEGETLPVDSVNYLEAEEFCQRLGWVLGREVRLPTREEYRRALGPLRYVDLDAVAWHLDNSGRRTHPVDSKEVNANGFAGLLGNVAEWLKQESTGSQEALVAGGHALDSTDRLLDVPFEEKPIRTRDRMTGFRCVVIVPEWTDAPAAGEAAAVRS